MSLNYDDEKIKAFAEQLQSAGDYFSIVLDVMQWKVLVLPRFEQLMLADYIRKYKVTMSGLSEAEYRKYLDISQTYNRLKDFYNRRVPEIEKYAKHGVILQNDYEYNINLSIDEACKTYCSVDKERAEEIDRIISNIEKSAVHREKDIKDAYRGDLASQLGMNREIFEKKAAEADERIKALFEQTRRFIDNNAGLVSDLGKMISESIGYMDDNDDSKKTSAKYH